MNGAINQKTGKLVLTKVQGLPKHEELKGLHTTVHMILIVSAIRAISKVKIEGFQ